MSSEYVGNPWFHVNLWKSMKHEKDEMQPTGFKDIVDIIYFKLQLCSLYVYYSCSLLSSLAINEDPNGVKRLSTAALVVHSDSNLQMSKDTLAILSLPCFLCALSLSLTLSSFIITSMLACLNKSSSALPLHSFTRPLVGLSGLSASPSGGSRDRWVAEMSGRWLEQKAQLMSLHALHVAELDNGRGGHLCGVTIGQCKVTVIPFGSVFKQIKKHHELVMQHWFFRVKYWNRNTEIYIEINSQCKVYLIWKYTMR